MRDLIVDALATFRLTRLWTTDTYPPVVAARERAERAVERRHGAEWAEGVTCSWCVSPYLAAAALAARRYAPRQWDVAARVLAFSEVAGLGARLRAFLVCDEHEPPGAP